MKPSSLTLPSLDTPTILRGMGGPISVTPEVSELHAKNAPVAIGVSGGKDSCALALATVDYLDRIGHAGPRLLIHSDLGRVEWQDSLPTCERLAAKLGLELIVVKRKAGDLMDRWLTRWENNVARYQSLRCVKLILPWSTASMRFCTSELKTAIICRYLVERFRGQVILNAVGIRRQESDQRAKAPIAARQSRLGSKTYGTSGYNWNAIIEWTKDEALDYLRAKGFALHEAYGTYGSSRVSCAFCILGSRPDLLAASACPDNHDIYREMVGLEIASAFSFHDSLWLGDVAPRLLDSTMRDALAEAKLKAKKRAELESRIPKHLLYKKGWPTCIPTMDEAELLADARNGVAGIMDIAIRYQCAAAIISRYEELMEENRRKGGQVDADESDDPTLFDAPGLLSLPMLTEGRWAA